MPTDVLIALGAALVVFGAFVLVMGRWEKAVNAAMATADHFQVKGFEASIDRANCEVRICVEVHARIFRAPLGHLVVEHKVETVTVAHEKRPRKRCRIALTSKRRWLLATGHYVASRDWAQTVWTGVETGKTWVQLGAVRLPAYYAQHWADWKDEQTNVLTDCMDVPLPNANARAFKAWLEHHQRELFPDRAAVREKWDQTCAELLRACRQQRDHGDIAAAFETWSFSARPAISYLVVEVDGAVFWASGDTPMLEPVESASFKSAGRVLTVTSGNDSRPFPLPEDWQAPQRALKRRENLQRTSMRIAKPFRT